MARLPHEYCFVYAQMILRSGQSEQFSRCLKGTPDSNYKVTQTLVMLFSPRSKCLCYCYTQLVAADVHKQIINFVLELSVKIPFVSAYNTPALKSCSRHKRTLWGGRGGDL